MAIFRIKLGKEVTDSITGYKGTVTARCEYITGCVQYQVTPKHKEDGKYDEGCWLDEDRLVAKAAKRKSSRAYTPVYSGGPQSNPPPMK